MNKIMKRVVLILPVLLLLTIAAAGQKVQDVEITVTGIRSDKGQIAVGVFLDDKSFQAEKAFLEYQFPKQEISGGVMTFSIGLKPGVYGLSLLDDEDSDRQMKYGMLGIPREGFGFSGYYHTGFTKPAFDAFSFTVEAGRTKKITVRMRYICR
jgi:uncharacterized protein (DUF2141 family)